jgi:hypothetical protein
MPLTARCSQISRENVQVMHLQLWAIEEQACALSHTIRPNPGGKVYSQLRILCRNCSSLSGDLTRIAYLQPLTRRSEFVDASSL